MTRTRAAALLAASALGVCLTSACGTGHHSSSAAAAPAAKQTAGSDSAVRLAARQIDKLGPVVTDSKGMTLYRFDMDSANPSTSNCNGPCQALWPPVAATGNQVQLSGIDKSLVGTVTRIDGSTQLTLRGWPLYRYAKDIAPGQARGQAVSNIWFAAAPDGRKAVATGADAAGYGY